MVSFLDLLPGLEDGGAAAEVDVAGRQAEALVVAAMVVVVDEVPDGSLEYYSGTASVRPVPSGHDLLFAGTYHRPGSDPWPWFATGNTRG